MARQLACAVAVGEMMRGIRREVLREICDGRWENLGRLGSVVPFTPLRGEGRRSVVTRQLDAVSVRLRASWGGAAPSLRLSPRLVDFVCERWEDDLGGRSTRDFIEETVVEALAEALDGERGALTAQHQLLLDVAPGERAGGGERVAARVCAAPEELSEPQVAS